MFTIHGRNNVATFLFYGYKINFILFSFISFFYFEIKTSAQNAPQATSKQRKFYFQDIVNVDSLNEPALFNNAEKWLKINFDSSNFVAIKDSVLSVKSSGKFLVYTKGIVSKEIHGAINYNIIIDIKSGKYRYTFEDFFFEYYKQGRDYKYHSTGKLKSLEDEKFPGWQSAWERYKKETLAKVNKQILSLKIFMVTKPQTPEIREVEKKEW